MSDMVSAVRTTVVYVWQYSSQYRIDRDAKPPVFRKIQLLHTGNLRLSMSQQVSSSQIRPSLLSAVSMCFVQHSTYFISHHNLDGCLCWLSS